MKRTAQLLALMLVCFMSLTGLKAQDDIVKWDISANANDDGTHTLVFKASIKDGWKLYDTELDIPAGKQGPNPALFKMSFDGASIPEGACLDRKGKLIGPADDAAFEGIKVSYFKKKAYFRQKVKFEKEGGKVLGYFEYQACETSCIYPDPIAFEFVNKGGQVTYTQLASWEGTYEALEETPRLVSCDIEGSPAKKEEKAIAASNGDEHGDSADASLEKKGSANDLSDKSLLFIFFTGLSAGLIALFTPCVFPMIPMTVSFFTKRSGTRKKGIRNAIMYSLCIIVIFQILGFGITLAFGENALNNLASNIYFNLGFFVLLVVFAISFFGAFEITLPSVFVNKMDAASDKGGFVGMFFMAFTLVAVSFSCTAPIVGSLIGLIAAGGFWGPVVGLGGFGIALALPFGLFAAFPGWMNSLPKSGGWLNMVKVSLAFVELALALKFLSAADLVGKWGLLPRDIFIALWIIIGVLWGVYLLGFIRFSHDSPRDPGDKIPIARLFLIILIFSFVVYLIPGMWGANRPLISGVAPPLTTQQFTVEDSDLQLKKIQSQLKRLGSSGVSAHGGGQTGVPHPGNKSPYVIADAHCPNGFDCFFDIKEATEYAKQVNKPLLLDFTGHTCANCRLMEDNVWTNDEVWEVINYDYVLVSLFCDDRTKIEKEYRKTPYFPEKEVLRVGDLWKNYQNKHFGTIAQPLYVPIDLEGNTLMDPIGYTPNAEEYLAFLKEGLKNFKK